MRSIQAAVAYLRARSVRTLRDPANLRARSVRTWKRCTWSSSTITKASNSRDKRIHLVAGSTIISSLWKRFVWSIEHNHYLRSSLLTDTILCCSQFEQLWTSSRDMMSRTMSSSRTIPARFRRGRDSQTHSHHSYTHLADDIRTIPCRRSSPMMSRTMSSSRTIPARFRRGRDSQTHSPITTDLPI